MVCPVKTDINYRFLQEKYGNDEANYHWFINSKRFSLDTDITSKIASSKVLTELARRIQKLNPDIKFKFINDAQADDLGIEGTYVKAYAEGDTIYVNLDRASVADPIEELGHFWMAAIKKDDPGFYQSLVNLANEAPQQLKNQLLKGYQNLSKDDQGEEIFTKLVGKKLAKGYSKTHESYFDKFVNFIDKVATSFVNFFKKLFGGNVNVDDPFELFDYRLDEAITIFGDKIFNESLQGDKNIKRKYSLGDSYMTQQEIKQALIDINSKVIERDQDKYTIDNKNYFRTTRLIQSQFFSDLLGIRNLTFDLDKWKETQINKFVKTPNYKTSSKEIQEKLLEEYEQELEKTKDLFDILPDLGTVFHYGMEIIFDNPTKEKFKEELQKELSKYNLYLEDNVIEKVYNNSLNFKKEIKLKHPNAEILRESKLYTTALTKRFLDKADLENQPKGIAGTADLIVIEKDGTVHTYDFKFSAKKADQWSTAKLNTIEYQQSIYKHIIATLGTKKQVKFGKAYIVPGEIITNLEQVIKDNEDLEVTDVTIDPIYETTDAIVDANVRNIIDIPQAFTNTKKTNNDNIHQVLDAFFNIEKKTASKPTKKQIEGTLKFFKEKRKNSNNPDKFYNPFREADPWVEINEQNIEDYLTLKKAQSPASNFVRNYNNSLNDEKYKLPKDFKNFIEFYAKHYTITESGEKEYMWSAVITPELEELDMVLMISKNGLAHIINFSSDPYNEKLTLNTEGLGEMKSTILSNFNNIQTNKKGDQLFTAEIQNLNFIKGGLFVANNKDLLDALNVRPQFFISIAKNTDKEGSVIRYMDPRSVLFNIKEMSNINNNNEGVGLRTIKNPILDNIKSQPEQYGILDKNNYKQNIVGLIDMFIKQGKYNELGDTTENFLEELKEATDESLISLLEERVRYLIKESPSSNEQEGPNLQALSSEYKEELILISEILLDLKNVRWVDTSDIVATFQFSGAENASTTPPSEITNKAISNIYMLQQKAFDDFRITFEERVNTIQDEFKKVLGMFNVDYQYDKYKNMLEYKYNTETDQWIPTYKFRNPNDTNYVKAPFQDSLSPEQAQLIEKLADITTNSRRQKGYTVDKENRYDLPLMRSSSLTKFRQSVGDKGIVKALKSSIKEQINDITNPENLVSNDEQRSNLSFRVELSDTFGMSDNPEQREKLINAAEIGDFEIDVEAIMYSYIYNESKLDTLNKALPYINAYKSILMLMGAVGPFQQYPELTKFIDKLLLVGNMYQKKTISKDDEKNLFYANMLKRFTSNLAIGFSASTALINFYTNIWNSISATVGSYNDRVDLNSVKKAFTFVTRNIPETIDNINFLDALSEYFGVHNMEPSKFMYEMRRDKGGAMNFERWMHFMNSYPDFIFRMSMFIAEAQKEGVIDIKNGKISNDSALTYDAKNDKIIYDETKDKRFKNYLGNKINDEAKKEEALYKAIANSLGSTKLTRPYDSNLLESKRRLSDSIYQDVSSENRSWFERTSVGSLFMMFKKWMEAKRYLYWREPSILEAYGSYQEVDKRKDGSYVYDWKGRPMEGILNSLFYYMRDAYQTKDLIGSAQKLKPHQVRNLKHGLADMTQFLLMSIIASALGETDKQRRKDIDQWLLRVMHNSVRDLNIINTINSITGQNNNFFVIGYMNSTFTSLMQAASNPESVSGFLSKFGVVRPIVQLTGE